LRQNSRAQSLKMGHFIESGRAPDAKCGGRSE